MAASKKPPKRIRVNYRLPEDLVKWVKKVAKLEKTTATDIIISALKARRAA